MISVRLTSGDKDINRRRNGMLIRFNEQDVISSMGRNAAGVKAITLGEDAPSSRYGNC